MGKLRLGLVGLGFMGQGVHLQNFLQIKDCGVVAIADKRADLAEGVAQRHGIPRTASSADELIADPDLDALALIVAPQMNPRLGTAALRAGKHVFVEKPLAVATSEARKLVAAAAAADRVLACGYMKRHDPGVLLARDLLNGLRESDELGGIEAAEVEFFQGDWTRDYGTPAVISAIPREAMHQVLGGGIPEFVRPEDHDWYWGLISNQCHQINLMRWLLGDPMELTFARIRTAENMWNTRLLAAFDYGSFECSFRSGRTMTEQWWEDVTIHFQRGWVRIQVPPPLAPGLSANVQVYRKGSGLRELPSVWGWSFRREAEQFVEAALGRATSLAPGEDAIKDLEIFETMYRRQFLADSNTRWPL